MIPGFALTGGDTRCRSSCAGISAGRTLALTSGAARLESSEILRINLIHAATQSRLMNLPETLLSVLPGSNDQERVAVFLCHQGCGASCIELRQQSWGDGVGWFTQSKVLLEPDQVADLRDTLGKSGNQPRSRHILPKHGRTTPSDFVPRLVRAETA